MWLRVTSRWVLIAVKVALSIIALIVVLLWARSNWFPDGVYRTQVKESNQTPYTDELVIVSNNGNLRVRRTLSTPTGPYAIKVLNEDAKTGGGQAVWQYSSRWEIWFNWRERSPLRGASPIRWGYSAGTFDSWLQERQISLIVSHWVIALALAAWPLVSLTMSLARQRRERARQKAGCCRNCGYDLRGSPHQSGAAVSPCPECGELPKRP
jgi:hypothetical protein